MPLSPDEQQLLAAIEKDFAAEMAPKAAGPPAPPSDKPARTSPAPSAGWASVEVSTAWNARPVHPHPNAMSANAPTPTSAPGPAVANRAAPTPPAAMARAVNVHTVTASRSGVNPMARRGAMRARVAPAAASSIGGLSSSPSATRSSSPLPMAMPSGSSD